MFRLSKMGGKVYGVKINSLSDSSEEDLANIDILVEEGTSVFLCADLGDAVNFFGVPFGDFDIV